MDNPKILVIGDVTIDVFLAPEAGEAFCQMKEHEQYICFSYGDKIPVNRLDFFTGGNAANVAIGLQRLGVDSSIMTTLGSDTVSTIILNELKKESVNTSYVTVQQGISSNYSTIISFQGERTIFTYHAPKTYVFNKNAIMPNYVYLTSMGERFLPFYQDLISLLTTQPDVTLMFNPGSLQMRANNEDIENILHRTNILFVNRKEAETFSLMTNSQGKEKEILQTLQKRGPHTVILTDGEHGVYAANNETYLHTSIIPVTVIEKTGAGDAFNAAFISATLEKLPFNQAIQWGTMNAASVIGYIGAQKGLLNLKDIESWNRIFEKSNVQTIEL